jgi:RimJ/RimL family protein N-acetyltransferase
MLLKEKIIIQSPTDLKLLLRSIDEGDLELLRQWKNDHRSSFFYQEIIKPEEQEHWYVDFCKRQHDYMFLVCYDDLRIGCMGFRLIDNVIDIYNVILGIEDYSGQGLMSKAMALMNQFIASRYHHPVTAKIVKNNPALKWYEKNGFKAIETNEQYNLVILNN